VEISSSTLGTSGRVHHLSTGFDVTESRQP